MNQITKAYAFFEQNQSEKAIELLNEFLNKANDEEKVHAAYLFLEFGFIQNAQEIMVSLHDKAPNNSEYKTILADIFIELEEDDQAINLLHDIDSDDPYYLSSLLQLADLYQAQGLFEVAEQKLFEAKHYNPNEKIIDLALGELFFSIGKYEQSINFYERLLPDIEVLSDISIITRLAEANAAVGKYEKAFNYFQQLSNKEDPDILFKYGLTAFHLKRLEIAISVWEQLIERDPHYYVLYYYLGKAYQEEGMLEEAYHIVKEGFRYDEHNSNLYNLAANLAYHLNDIEDSKAYILHAIELNPEDQQAVLFYIKLLSDLEEYEDVVNFIENISEYDIYDPQYDWELARAYNELDEIEKATLHYQEALKSLTSDVKFLKEYGFFLAEIGERQEAINVLQQYLDLEPMDENIIDYIHRLGEI